MWKSVAGSKNLIAMFSIRCIYRARYGVYISMVSVSMQLVPEGACLRDSLAGPDRLFRFFLWGKKRSGPAKLSPRVNSLWTCVFRHRYIILCFREGPGNDVRVYTYKAVVMCSYMSWAPLQEDN